jgi:DNA (cytosine-5)-methyltransferase 1
MNLNKEFTVISTFAGCGGSSLGYKWAGFKELLAIEWDNNAVETFKLNFPEVPVWQKDIAECYGNDILEFCNIQKGELDILDGSPPCQGFSTAGKRNINDNRNDLFKEFVRLIKELNPKIFVMENVSGMAKGSYKGKFNEILKDLKSLDYNVKVKLMNSKWYEVPQSRERLIFIGIRKNLNKEPVYPEPINKIITFYEATKNCENREPTPKITKSIINYIPLLKQGQTLADITGKGFQTFRIYNNKVCPTITKFKAGIGFGMLIHPLENRVLNISEMKKCSSFPDEFIFIGKWINVKERIGNAVMPKFMYHIAKTLKNEILEKI